jgi:uncharacterized protein (TIGR00369 family)
MALTHEQLQKMGDLFTRMVPHNSALGIRFVETSVERTVLDLPYREDLVGNPEAGTLHGGPITALVDATCGLAVMARLQRRVKRVATIDLRIDYLKPATAGLAVRAEATCFRATRHIGFARATAFHDPGDPIAVATGTFMIFAADEAPSAAKENRS